MLNIRQITLSPEKRETHFETHYVILHTIFLADKETAPSKKPLTPLMQPKDFGEPFIAILRAG